MIFFFFAHAHSAAQCRHDLLLELSALYLSFTHIFTVKFSTFFSNKF
jgi:hypothetical protein